MTVAERHTGCLLGDVVTTRRMRLRASASFAARPSFMKVRAALPAQLKETLMNKLTQLSFAAIVVAAMLGAGCSKRDDASAPPASTAPAGAMAPASAASQ